MRIKLFYLGTSGSNPEELFEKLESEVNEYVEQNNIKEFETDTNIDGGHSPDFGYVTQAVVTLKYKLEGDPNA